MPPLWKIPRELSRIWRQISYVFVHPVELLIFRVLRGLKPNSVRTQTGDQAMGSDVAVFLIYQPNGLEQSTIQTCKHLQENGYSVVLVSNCQIGPRDWDHLSPYVAKLIERPNFGYDFGGYRHAILEILAEDHAVENLLMLNDSVWFPVLEQTQLLDQMRDDPAPVTGPLFHVHRNPRRSHLQSYMINFAGEVVRSLAFREFWTNYSATNNKVQTIRRGEMGLSEALRNAGFALKPIFDQPQVSPALQCLSDENFRLVLSYEMTRNYRYKEEIRGVLSNGLSGAELRAQALKLFDKPDWRRYFLTNHPAINIATIGFPILKKDRGFEYGLQRDEFLAMLDADQLPLIDPVVEKEIRAFANKRPKRFQAQSVFNKPILSATNVPSQPAQHPHVR